MKPNTLSIQYIPTSCALIKEKFQRDKSVASEGREKRSCRETHMPVGCNYIVDIKVKEEVLIKGRTPKKRVERRDQDGAFNLALQNELHSEGRQRRCRSSSLEVESLSDIVTRRKSTNSSMELEPKVSLTQNAENLRKCQCSLVTRGLQKEMKTITEKDRTSVKTGLDSHQVSRSWQKVNTCSSFASESRPQQKTWNLRERIKPVWPDQKVFRRQDKSQQERRRLPKLESSVQNLSILKYRGEKRVTTSPKSQLDLRYPVTVKAAAVSHLANKFAEGTVGLIKDSRLSWEKPQEQKRERKNTFMALTDSKLQKCIKSNQKSQHLMEFVAKCEESKKCKSPTADGVHRMMTRIFSKSKMCKSDGGNESWKSEKNGTEILGCRQGILEKKKTREQMDCVLAEDLLVTKTEECSKEQSEEKDEIVTSAELIKEIKTSRKDTLEVLSIQYGKQPEAILSTSQDCSKQPPLACFPVTESDEIKSNNSVCPYFWRETEVYYNDSISVTNSKCPQHFDIKVAEEKIENALVEYQGEILGWCPSQDVSPYKIKKIPVVKLLDCCYIKALLEPAGIKPTQSYTVNCGSLHVAHDQKSLSPKGMGQNDLSSSPNVVHAVKSLPQKDSLVSKKMCQYSKNCQNGKRLRESKLCMDLKKPSKRLKMSVDIKETPVEVLTNVAISSECGIQIEDKTTVDSLVISEKLNCSETSTLPLLDCLPNLTLEQTSQNQVSNLLNNEKANKEHFDTYSSNIFEKSLVLKTVKDELKQMEAYTDLSKMDKDKFIVATLDSEKSTSCHSKVAACMKRKMTCEIKINKAGGKQQLFSCQRAVPINGKNTWPRESCARTSLWVPKNHALDLERRFLKQTDSVNNYRELELYKPLADGSKISAGKILHHKMECTVENHLSDSVLHIGKSLSTVTGNENRFSSVAMERSKRSTSATKTLKKSKVALNSLGKDVKNSGNVGKKNFTIDNRNGMFADSGKKTKGQTKTSVSKQELLMKNLITGTLSNFKIPLLKGKNNSRKIENARSTEKDICNPLNILENSVSVKESPRPQFYSEQINCIPARKECSNQFDSDIPEDFLKKRSAHNKCVRTFHESELELLALKASPPQSRHIEKPPETNIARIKEDICADILKAYEDDVLVIDVIQDDPDLFGDPDEQEGVCTKQHSTNNLYTSSFSANNLELEFESTPLPKGRHLKSVRESVIQDYETLKSGENADVLLTKVDQIKPKSLNGISSIGVTQSSLEDEQLTEPEEFTESFDPGEKCRFSEKLLAVQEHKASFQDNPKSISYVSISPFGISGTTQYVESLSHDHQLELPFSTVKAIVPQHQGTTLKSWMNDFRFPRKGPPLPSSHTNNYESWKVEKNSVSNLGLTSLPRTYCRYHFNSLNGCERPNCRYLHTLVSGNEKLCSEIIKKYISIGEVVLLQRAVCVFSNYYKEGVPVGHFDSQMFCDLLTSLLQSCLLKELFLVVHTGIMIKLLPTIDFLLKMFEKVASMKLRETVPELIDIFYKLIDAGIVLECVHIDYITMLLNELQTSGQKITLLMSRFQGTQFHKASFCDFDSAVAEFQHCKEKSDWTKLGTLYVNVKRGCKNVDDLEKYLLHVASILTSSVKEGNPGIPFCEFAAAVNADVHHDEADMTSLGRIGISVMFSYYKIQQWSKAKKVLNVLHVLKIHFTFLKGIFGQERLASICHIVNVAVEVFLKCGSLDGALWVLRESEWIINTISWPCDRMDVLNRHNLLCTIASELISKKWFGETFEVLRNLPGFQNSCDSLDVSQYSVMFNKLLSACSENKNIRVSSTIVEFMLARNIPVDFNLLRALITALGRSCLWLKARTCYKSALALGCYPRPEGNLYRKLLLIPSYMTEIEMLLAIEIFLVSNASSIQSPGASNQTLQIVLKRCEGDNIRNNEDYQSAVERLIQAAYISSPKLLIRHLTVNVNLEHVYSLEHTCVLTWLKENMKWAGKVWLF